MFLLEDDRKILEPDRTQYVPLNGSQKARLINMRLAHDAKDGDRCPGIFLVRCRSLGGLVDKLRGQMRRALVHWFCPKSEYAPAWHYGLRVTYPVDCLELLVGVEHKSLEDAEQTWIASQTEAPVPEREKVDEAFWITGHSEYFESRALPKTRAS